MAKSISSEPAGDNGSRDAELERRFAEQRAELVTEIESEVDATAYATGRAALDRRVIDAIAAVPRHEFVPEHLRALAYRNHPLPIGEGQTISQPYIVALMTDLLETRPDQVILEIGTGSGYQAAVLARLVRHVYSIEIVEALAERAAATLARLGVGNVSVRAGDGGLGWPEHAPYDGVIVTAAGARVPQALVEQLKTSGRLVMPIGRDGYQDLTVATKATNGTIATRAILPVAFVPLV